jgi:hypothetical protein
MQPGPKYERISLAFEGAVGIAPDRLNRIIAQQHLENQLFTDPIVVTDLLERYYREQGYLSAEIDAPRYEFQATNACVVLLFVKGLGSPDDSPPVAARCMPDEIVRLSH